MRLQSNISYWDPAEARDPASELTVRLLESFNLVPTVGLKALNSHDVGLLIAVGFPQNEWSEKKGWEHKNKKKHPPQKTQSFYNLISEVTTYYSCYILFIRNKLLISKEPKNPTCKEKIISISWRDEYQKICGLICKTTKSSLVCTLYSSNMQIYTPSQGHQKSHATAASAKSRILPSKLSPNVDKTLKI